MDPGVLKRDILYEMWFSGAEVYEDTLAMNHRKLRTGYATSPDDIHWTKYSGNPVLDLGLPGEWDDEASFTPSVIFDGCKYEMWYTGIDTLPPPYPDPYHWDIGYATAPLMGIEEESNNRGRLTENNLLQNFPNPFNLETVIGYYLPSQSQVFLDIYDITGRSVRSLVVQNQSAGNYSVIWNGKNECGERVNPGVYFCKLEACGERSEFIGEFVTVKKLILLR